MCELKKQLESEGRKVYGFPSGGSNDVGTWGYVQAIAEVEIVPQWSPSTQEPYDDQGVEAVESLLFSWFIDDPASELVKQRSSDVAPGNTFSPGALEEDETERLVTLWLVARDDRGGVTWLSRQLRIVQGE